MSVHASIAALPPLGAGDIQERLVRSLAEPGRLGELGGAAQLLETHISWVLLAGGYAWKIKKPVDLGFLDFSTLARRRHFCEEELRLNRRLAPELYLDVVAISGTPDAPRLASVEAPAVGHAFEYAVRMARFPQSALADRMLAAGALLPSHMDELALLMARFHESAPRAGAGDAWGRPEHVLAPARQNFSQIRTLGVGEEGMALATLEAWSQATFDRLATWVEARHQGGFVRECHGDLHLGNIAVVDGRVRVFDGIEFNADLRWIDIQSEVAFLVMDLTARGRADYAARFLNAWLQHSGDYAGLCLQPWYQVYRAMVRAKVARIRAAQPGLATAKGALARADFLAHLRLASTLGRPGFPVLLLTHGFSGAGKTTATQALVESLGAVRLRSDVERKRLCGLDAGQASGSALGTGLYREEMGHATYAELRRLARLVLGAGYPAIVDATFLRRQQRDEFRALAGELELPFLILDCCAEGDELRRRVACRIAAGTDASEATLEVLERQMATAEPLGAEEAPFVLAMDTAQDDLTGFCQRVRRRLGWSGADAWVEEC